MERRHTHEHVSQCINRPFRNAPLWIFFRQISSNGHPIGHGHPEPIAEKEESDVLDHESEAEHLASIVRDSADLKTSEEFKGLLVGNICTSQCAFYIQQHHVPVGREVRTLPSNAFQQHALITTRPPSFVGGSSSRANSMP